MNRIKTPLFQVPSQNMILRRATAQLQNQQTLEQTKLNKIPNNTRPGMLIQNNRVQTFHCFARKQFIFQSGYHRKFDFKMCVCVCVW